MTILKDKFQRQKLRHELYQKLDSEGVRLPEAVQTLRKILAKDQATFSKEVGIALSTLRKIEQDSGNVSIQTIGLILDKYSLELVVRTKRQ